jgi:hypothetical protein
MKDEGAMNQPPDNPAIFVAKFLWAYLSPVDKYKKVNESIDNRTKGLDAGVKNRISKIYLTLFLLSSFFFIWLSYFELKSTLDALSVYRHPDCGVVAGACGDTWLSGFVKQNNFMISSILEVSFLAVGVVVGNIGWDQASTIKKSGLEEVYRFFNVTITILVVSIVVSLICNNLVDVVQNEYYYRFSTLERFLPFVVYLVVLIIIHMFYLSKKLNKKIQPTQNSGAAD